MLVLLYLKVLGFFFKMLINVKNKYNWFFIIVWYYFYIDDYDVLFKLCFIDLDCENGCYF